MEASAQLRNPADDFNNLTEAVLVNFITGDGQSATVQLLVIKSYTQLIATSTCSISEKEKKESTQDTETITPPMSHAQDVDKRTSDENGSPF